MAAPLFTVESSERLDIEGDFALDSSVLKKMPKGTVVKSANSYGSSAWTRTARIEAINPDGTPKRYFLKVATKQQGKAMMEGEFNAMKALYAAKPSFVPKPHDWGEFAASNIPTYFFLCDFIEMDNKLPNAKVFCSLLADLHRTSVSPTGMFGFHISTCHGKHPQVVDWDPSWASFFAKLLRGALKQDRELNGTWDELDKVADRVISHVIPRLLGVLQAEGRELKPCLIHGDLWEGNIGTDFETGNIYIFDSGAYYAHNEMEIGMWRCTRHKINSKVFKRQYLREFTISEPRDEWDDRNRLYCVKMNIIHSAHHTGSIVRETYETSFHIMSLDAVDERLIKYRAFDDMTFLVEKYAPWLGADIADGMNELSVKEATEAMRAAM